MSSFDTDIAIPVTITDMCEQREKIVGMVTSYYGQMKLADSMMREMVRYGLPSECVIRGTLKDCTKDIDRQFWRAAFEKTGYMQLLDAASRKVFDEDMRQNPPVFNVGNIRSTFISLSQTSEQMFSDGIVNVFRRLSGNYQTNDAFKIGHKIIMSGMMQHRWSGGLEFRYGWSDDQINDIDRVIKTLDGKKHTPRELSCAMVGSFGKKEIYEDQYYRAKAFKNSNLHLEFKRADLVDKINLIIAKHYGEGRIAA